MKKAMTRWLVLAAVTPIAAWALGKAATKAEQSRGRDSKLAKGLRFGRNRLRSA